MILILFAYSDFFNVCYENLACREGLMSWIKIFSPYIHLFIPLFLFSLITYWMREEIYKSWFRFARWFIPLSMLLTLIAPEYSSDWLYPIVKGTVALLTSIIFAALSLLIILIKYLRPNR